MDVYAYGITAPPSHGFCATCEWLCEHVREPAEVVAQMQRFRGFLSLKQRR